MLRPCARVGPETRVAMTTAVRKWPKEALHPDGFDVITMGPKDSLAELRVETKKPLDTAEAIEAHVEEWIAANTYPWPSCVAQLGANFLLLLVIPVIIGAVV